MIPSPETFPPGFTIVAGGAATGKSTFVWTILQNTSSSKTPVHFIDCDGCRNHRPSPPGLVYYTNMGPEMSLDTVRAIMQVAGEGGYVIVDAINWLLGGADVTESLRTLAADAERLTVNLCVTIQTPRGVNVPADWTDFANVVYAVPTQIVEA